jgi:hypothetical protein
VAAAHGRFPEAIVFKYLQSVFFDLLQEALWLPVHEFHCKFDEPAEIFDEVVSCPDMANLY